MEPNERTWLGRIRRSPFIFPLAVAVGLAMLAFSEATYWRASQGVESVRHRVDARAEIQAVLRCMADAESGERGYLLTGRADYLAHYHACQKDIALALTSLARRNAADPPGRALVDRLRSLVERKLSELGTTIDLYNAGQREAWATVLLTDVGREQMDAIRSLSMQLVALETQRVEQARAELGEALLLNRIGIGAMIAISVLALAMYQRQTAALDAQRREQQRLVQAERDLLERQVAQRTEELTELTHHLDRAAEEARARLARELHDELGALLTAAKLDTARIKAWLGSQDPARSGAFGHGDGAALATRLEHLADLLNEVIVRKRRMIEDLRPSTLSHLGLRAALDILLTAFRRDTGLALDLELGDVALAPQAALTLYRLVEEALSNVATHAAARHVQVRLVPDGEHARLEVQDDGVGFDVARRHAAWHGLVGMRYRVQAVNGHFELHSRPGEGTRVVARVPLRAEKAPCQAAPTGSIAGD